MVALAPVGVLGAALLLGLPDRLAIGWGPRGADRLLDTTTVTALAVGTGALAVAGAAVVHRATRPTIFAGRSLLGLAGVVSGAAAGFWALVATLAATAADPTTPPAPGVQLVIPALGALLGGRLAAATYGSPPVDPAPPPPAPELPRASLPASDPPRWQQQTVSGFFLAAVLLVLVVGAGAYRAAPLAALVCLVFAVCTVLLVRLRFQLDERGLELGLWGGRGPRLVLGWDELVEARAVRLRPFQRSGGGLRVIPARTGGGLRAGPGLVLTLTDGRRLGITLDDPVLPAGLVNAYLDRLRGSRVGAER